MTIDIRYSRVDVYRDDRDGKVCLYLFALDVFYNLHCFRCSLFRRAESGKAVTEAEDVAMERMWSVPLPFDDMKIFRREDEGEVEEPQPRDDAAASEPPGGRKAAPLTPSRVANVHCESRTSETDTIPREGSVRQASTRVEVDWLIKEKDDHTAASYTPLNVFTEQVGRSRFTFLQNRKDVLATLDVDTGTFRNVHPFRPKPSAPAGSACKKSTQTSSSSSSSGSRGLSFLCKGTVEFLTLLSSEEAPAEQLMQRCELTLTPSTPGDTQRNHAVSLGTDDDEKYEPCFFRVQGNTQGVLTATVRRAENSVSGGGGNEDHQDGGSFSANALLFSFVLAVEGDGPTLRTQLYPLGFTRPAAARTVSPSTLAPLLIVSLRKDEDGSLCGPLVRDPGAPDDVLLYVPAPHHLETNEEDEAEAENTVENGGERDGEESSDDDWLPDLDDLYGSGTRRPDSFYSYTYSTGSSAVRLDPDLVSSSATRKSGLSSCSQPVISPVPFFSSGEEESSDGSGKQSSALVPARSPLRPTTSPLMGDRGEGTNAFFYSFFDDNFEPLSFLGKGAGGAVLLARHKLTNQFFAIKVLIVTNYQSEKEVLKEVRVHASLNSYNYNNTSNAGSVVYRRPALLMDTAAETEEKEADDARGVMADGRNILQFYNCWSEAVSPARARQLYEVGILSKAEAGLRHTTSPTHTVNAWGRFPTSPDVRPDTHRRANSADKNTVTLVGEESLSSTPETETDTDSEREIPSEEEAEGEETTETSSSPTLPVCAPGDDAGLTSGACVPYRPPKRAGGANRSSSSFVGSRVVFLQMELCQMTLGRFLAERSVKLNDRYAERCRAAAVPPPAALFSLCNRIENLILLLQIGKGLLYLHDEKHVLHRDLKPLNIFLDFHCQTALMTPHPAASLCGGSTSLSSPTSTNGVTRSSFSDIGRSTTSSYRPSPLVVQEGPATATTTTHTTEAPTPCCSTVACVASAASPSASLLPPESSTLLRHGGAPAHAHHQYIYQHAFKGIGLNDKVFTARMSSTDENKTSDLEGSERLGRPTKEKWNEKYTRGSRNDHGYDDDQEHGDEEADEERLKADMVNFILNFKYYSVEELLPLCRARCVCNKNTQRQQTSAWYMETLLKHYAQVRIGDLGLAKMLPLIAPLSGTGSGAGEEKNVAGQTGQPAHRPYDFYTAAENMNTEGAGSPMYASPEQLRGHPCTAAADVFSFGMIAVELYMAPTTISERLRVLQDARDGHFEALCRHHHLPTSTEALFTVFPELRLAIACLAPEPSQRTSLAAFLVGVEDILKACVCSYMHSC